MKAMTSLNRGFKAF